MTLDFITVESSTIIFFAYFARFHHNYRYDLSFDFISAKSFIILLLAYFARCPYCYRYDSSYDLISAKFPSSSLRLTSLDIVTITSFRSSSNRYHR